VKGESGAGDRVGDVPLDWRAFGTELRSRRRALRLSQEDAAQRAGIGDKTWWSLEHGQQHGAGYSLVVTAAAVVGMTPVEAAQALMSGTLRPTRTPEEEDLWRAAERLRDLNRVEAATALEHATALFEGACRRVTRKRGAGQNGAALGGDSSITSLAHGTGGAP
jgi:transcriptional regulator with XRE-family HTH domain